MKPRTRSEFKGPRTKRPIRKKVSKFKPEEIQAIDYKDTNRLRYFLTERGKIISSRVTGLDAKSQRHLVRQIQRARFLALVPYVAE